MPTASEYMSPRRKTDKEGEIYRATTGAPSYTFGQKELSFLENQCPIWGNVPGMLIAGNNRTQNATPGPGHYQALQLPPPGARRKRGGFEACVGMESFRSRAPHWQFAHLPALSEEQLEEANMRKLKHDPPGPGHYPVYGDFAAEAGGDGKEVTILSTRVSTPRWTMQRTHTGAFRSCALDKQALRTTARPSHEHERRIGFGEQEASRRAITVAGPSWSMGARREPKSENRVKAEAEAPGPGHYRTYGMFSPRHNQS